MADRVNVIISMVVTNLDGSPFTSTHLNYPGVSYANLLAMQKIGTAAMAEMTKLGEAKLAPAKS